jgi:hypothetical protein
MFIIPTMAVRLDYADVRAVTRLGVDGHDMTSWRALCANKGNLASGTSGVSATRSDVSSQTPVHQEPAPALSLPSQRMVPVDSGPARLHLRLD